MEIILGKIIDWIEWLKKSVSGHDKRITAIEDYLETSSEEKINELMKRLEALEREEELQEEKTLDDLSESEYELNEEVEEDVVATI